jgi:succinate-acetate transporter protein
MDTNIFTSKLQRLHAGVGLIGINALNFTTPILAVADLKQSFGKGLGIVMMMAFIFGLIKIITGAIAISNGNPEGKSAILGGLMIAGAPTIMFVLFRIFGIESGALTPNFSF